MICEVCNSKTDVFLHVNVYAIIETFTNYTFMFIYILLYIFLSRLTCKLVNPHLNNQRSTITLILKLVENFHIIQIWLLQSYEIKKAGIISISQIRKLSLRVTELGLHSRSSSSMLIVCHRKQWIQIPKLWSLKWNIMNLEIKTTFQEHTI